MILDRIKRPVPLILFELELTNHIDDDAISDLCCQFSIPCDYDGEGTKGTKFVFGL